MRRRVRSDPNRHPDRGLEWASTEVRFWPDSASSRIASGSVPPKFVSFSLQFSVSFVIAKQFIPGFVRGAGDQPSTVERIDDNVVQSRGPKQGSTTTILSSAF